jgi:PadR family transcriptional regulator AphA
MRFRDSVLGLLAQKPMSGYDIRKHLETLDWLIGSPSFGSLYPTLHGLLKDGLVTVDVTRGEGSSPRKVYSVTQAGRKAMREQSEQPLEPCPSLKDFAMHLLLASNFPAAGLLAHLEQRHSQVAARRTALERAIEEHGEKPDPRQRLVFDYGLSVAHAELAWLERMLKHLGHGPRDD